MVFFTCNSCGESLKKNKVDKHLSQCRSNSVSCVDCGKDFTRYDFQSHNQCISEDQKYGGLHYKPKDNSTKGKAKQEEWVEKVKRTIDESKCDNHIKGLLRRLSGYDNIPRKKQKFINFVRSCLSIRNDYYIIQMWTVFEDILKSDSNDNNNGNQKEETENGVKRVSNDSEINKRNKKQKSNETQNKEQTEYENRSEVNVENNKTNDSNLEEDNEDLNPTEGQQNDNFEAKPKLKIKKIVIQILENYKNNEMSVKKLKKKVIKRLKSMDENLSKEYIESKFLSKLKKIKKIELNEEKVSLKSQ